MRPKGTAAELEARRLRAADLLAKGRKPAEVAHLVGASLSSVKRWKRALAAGGKSALAAKPLPARQAKLSALQRQGLVESLLKGPLAAGYRTDLWTCRRVADLVQKTFGVSYHPAHLGRMLHDLGFTPQKPQVLARERDEQAIARWQKRDWPRLKKRPVAAEPA